MFKNVIAAIESSFVDCIPPHHLPSASSVDYESGSSQFFVTTQEEFEALKPLKSKRYFGIAIS
jgi:hypothetical protein